MSLKMRAGKNPSLNVKDIKLVKNDEAPVNRDPVMITRREKERSKNSGAHHSREGVSAF